jgi:26S proteasome regulatory subunit N1
MYIYINFSLTLKYISNPDYGVIDQLSRLSHDSDHELAQGAILGLGLVSAGTNNSRVAGLLRQLSDFYSREANHLFMVRLAQGLNSMGKGLISISPFSSDRLTILYYAML